MAYGFGARFEDQKDVNHCFPLNGNMSDPSIEGLENLICAYKETLKNVKLDGPTLFAPVMKQIIEFVNKKMALPMYNVLLMLTDGCIHDMRETIDKIVEASKLPLSIIIIGIGSANFDNMDVLDADDVELVDGFGEAASNDIVQFVEF